MSTGFPLKIQSLSKSFGSTVALNHLEIDVGRGEIVAFLGPNGAGKTTALQCILGLLQRDDGSIFVLGKEVLAEPLFIKKKIGYVPDRPFLYPRLTVWESISFVATIRKLENWEDRAKHLCSRLRLLERKNHLTDSLSHGMRQKVALVSAFLHRPDLLLLDEPMVGLDPFSRKVARELMKERAEEGGGILLSTHSLDTAEAVSHRMVILQRGEIVAQGTPSDLREGMKGKSNPLEEVFLTLTEENHGLGT